MVTALDLLTNTLNTIGDICQSEFKNADAGFNEEFNDNFDNEDYYSEDSTKETKKGLIRIKKEKKTSRKRKLVNYDEDYDPKKITKKENPDGKKPKSRKKIIGKIKYMFGFYFTERLIKFLIMLVKSRKLLSSSDFHHLVAGGGFHLYILH